MHEAEQKGQYMDTATVKPMEAPVVAEKVSKPLMAVEIMEGVTFSTLLILFCFMYVVIATSTFAGS